MVVEAKPRYGTDAADAVPGILLVRRLPLPFVALEEAGHEEFLRQRRELDAPGLPVVHDLVLVVEIHDLDDGARLRRVVGDLVAVVRTGRRAGGQSHQRVAVGRRHVGAVEQLLVREAVPLRRELGAAREDAGDAHLPDGRAHRLEPQRQRLEQLGRREHAADVVAGLQDRDRLIDDVILVGLEVLAPSLLDQLDHPPRVEIHTEADAAPRNCARCSTDRRSRRGPDGPSISQFEPFGKYSSGSVALNSS